VKTKAAILTAAGRPFDIVELDLDGPCEGEILIRYVAAGLCHSDLHLIDGDIEPRFPIVGGHEGAGVVEEAGPGVTKVRPGDHVVCSFIPSCGSCRYCSTGRQSLCDLGALFGSANPQYDIVRLLDLYQAGQIKLDELITHRYTLDQVNQGYQDLQDGKNIRGVLLHEH
jgi:Zn-dependent alcohol dehydrogenase